MSKIKAFTAKEPDTCCKCGKDITAGQEISWMRDPDRKGNFHTACEALPTIEGLTKVRVQAADSPLGFIWMRVNAIPATLSLGETTPATRLIPTEAVPELPPLKAMLKEAEAPLPGPWEVKSADGILLNALAKALLPALGKMVSEAVANGQPRIVVNVYVPKAGDEVKALDILSKELFLLDSVRTI